MITRQEMQQSVANNSVSELKLMRKSPLNIASEFQPLTTYRSSQALQLQKLFHEQMEFYRLKGKRVSPDYQTHTKRWIETHLDAIVKHSIVMIQNDKPHSAYQSDETVKIFDSDDIEKHWKRLHFLPSKPEASTFMGHLLYDTLYKGNSGKRMRSAIRFNDFSMKLMIEFMMNRCPTERLPFSTMILESELKLYHQTRLISQYIPEFRSRWHAERPLWQDDMIETTFNNLLLRQQLTAVKPDTTQASLDLDFTRIEPNLTGL